MRIWIRDFIQRARVLLFACVCLPVRNVASSLFSPRADPKIPIFFSCITWDTAWRMAKEKVIGSKEEEEQNHSPVKN